MSQDQIILEEALKVMATTLDDLIEACAGEGQSTKAPDRRSIMKAKSMLPPYCRHALGKPKGNQPAPL
jgi:hypothetical protein